ncbi:MAG: methylmalonyl-CoA decarboxylase [Elusimicrobia bacterium]|nr:methylmalonyl-CoA decarboxylase [Elusimicrobiota bacterium]
MPIIIKDIKNRIATLTLNNTAKKNALSFELCNELIDIFKSLKKDKIPVIIIRAEKNAKTWSSGHDIRQLPKVNHEPLAYDSPMEKLLRSIQEYPGVVIAMVQGGVWGGACDLVITCDLTLGDHTSTFAITPVRIGLPYNASGIMHFINRVGLNIAKEMFFTGKPCNAERAFHFGILNHLIAQDKLENFTLNIAQTIAENSPLAIAVIKEQFRILAEAHPIRPEAFERIQALRREVYNSHDYDEGIKAFFEKRKPNFKGE